VPSFFVVGATPSGKKVQLPVQIEAHAFITLKDQEGYSGQAQPERELQVMDIFCH
jgi:hypothetical protein